MMKPIDSILAALAAVVVALCAPAPAAAQNLGVLDPAPASPGHIVADAAGTGYLAWTHAAPAGEPDHAVFCRMPVGGTCLAPTVLPTPGAADVGDGITGAFPVLGSGQTVYVVGPRYVDGDTVVWTSTDGGQTFDGGVVDPGAYSGKTAPASVVRLGTRFQIGASNVGLGWSEASALGSTGQEFTFETGEDEVAGSSLALDPEGDPVEAYWSLSEPFAVSFYRYKGSGLAAQPANWVGPIDVGPAYEAKLAGGPSGLFLVSEDYAASEARPRLLDVRRFEGGTFGPPVNLADDADLDLFDGGAIAQSPSGRLDVAWPAIRGAEAAVMRIHASADGGSTYATSEVADLGSDYETGDNAQLAVADSGAGWLTFADSAGLQLADLTPLPAAVPASPVPNAPPAPPVPRHPGTYRGPKHTATVGLGGNLLYLRVPARCLAGGDAFFAGVGVKARHRVARSLGQRPRITKVTFALDGARLQTLHHRPFRILVDRPPLGPRTEHILSARVAAVIRVGGRSRHVIRTLTGMVLGC